VKKSKPPPAKSSFAFYKEKMLERNPEMTAQEIKEGWQNLNEQEKLVS